MNYIYCFNNKSWPDPLGNPEFVETISGDVVRGKGEDVFGGGTSDKNDGRKMLEAFPFHHGHVDVLELFGLHV